MSLGQSYLIKRNLEHELQGFVNQCVRKAHSEGLQDPNELQKLTRMFLRNTMLRAGDPFQARLAQQGEDFYSNSMRK